MLEFLKNYYVFMLVLMVFSYLVPKEDYKIYIQFFISIFNFLNKPLRCFNLNMKRGSLVNWKCTLI